LAVVTDMTVLNVKPWLEPIGYQAMGEFGMPGRHYFRKTSTSGVRTHQIHAFAVGSPDINRHLAFRDYLRSNPGEAQRYAKLKQELASLFSTDMDGYSTGKTEFIREIERRAASTR